MDVKDWMREQLRTGAFAHVNDLKPVELAKAARVALRLPREQWKPCEQWAREIMAEPRPSRPPRPEPLPAPAPQPCRGCGTVVDDGDAYCNSCDDVLASAYRMLVRMARMGDG